MQVTNHIFAKPNQPFGNDLIAIDINRGRDHGLPSYNAVRAACGLHPLKSFSQLKTEIRNSEVRIHANTVEYDEVPYI